MRSLCLLGPGLFAGLLLYSPGVPHAAPRDTVVPKGLTASDWTQVKRDYQRHRHQAAPDAGRAACPRWSQQWSIHFDGKGFDVEPDGGGWTWGLDLKSYGRPGQERAAGPAEISSDLDKIHYKRGALDEWFVNDERGLEQGFTLSERPVGAGGLLRFNLGLRGGLSAKMDATGAGVSFSSSSGQAILSYAGLKAWDANGRVLPARFAPDNPPGGVGLEVEEAWSKLPDYGRSYCAAGVSEASESRR